jgi:CheY-like chemotaxis protein
MQQEISVLVIEDEEIWAQQLELTLHGLGFPVTAIFDNTEDALIQLPTLSFDIALLDININGRNMGIQLGKIIREVYQKPFIFITGSIDNHTAKEALDAGPSAYLIKPVNDTSLFIAVQNAFANFEKKATANAYDIANAYESFFVKLGNRYKKIDWKDVVALVSDIHVCCWQMTQQNI